MQRVHQRSQTQLDTRASLKKCAGLWPAFLKYDKVNELFYM